MDAQPPAASRIASAVSGDGGTPLDAEDGLHQRHGSDEGQVTDRRGRPVVCPRTHPDHACPGIRRQPLHEATIGARGRLGHDPRPIDGTDRGRPRRSHWSPARPSDVLRRTAARRLALPR